MNTVSIREEEEFIKLGQALKKTNLVSSGVEAKMVITDGKVLVNGNVELQRGKKLHGGEIVSYNGEEFQVIR
jgi:ribosome-associated protein